MTELSADAWGHVSLSAPLFAAGRDRPRWHARAFAIFHPRTSRMPCAEPEDTALWSRVIYTQLKGLNQTRDSKFIPSAARVVSLWAT